MSSIGNWLYHYLGLKGSGPWYSFWSGFGSDIGEVVIIGGLISIYRQHTCHVQGCHRLHWKQWTDPDGHVHSLCRKHHPHDAPTAGYIATQATKENPS